MTRNLTHILSGTSVADGDGGMLRRYLGTQDAAMLDPFLLLDHFDGDVAERSGTSSAGGFPPPPSPPERTGRVCCC